MIKNYLKITLWILWQPKIYVAINLISLAFALSCCIRFYEKIELERDLKLYIRLNIANGLRS